jgi:serine/threonine protein kinase
MNSDYQGRYSQTEFAALDDPQLPERFQQYVIDKSKIGEGPTSYCYRAKRVDDGRDVRLKVFRKRICGLAGIEALWQKLSKISAQFQGENVLRYYGSGLHDNLLFLEFEYFESVSLRSIINSDAPCHPDLVVLIASQIIAGLNQVHGVKPSPGMGNIIPLHRNLSPENVLISPEGSVKITDIEMQQIINFCDLARLDIPYSPELYQSPEQLLRDGYADRRSDIYLLGLMMIEMTTGRFPYWGKDVFEMRQNVREYKHDRLDDIFPATKDADRKFLLKQFRKIVERMFEHDPEKRPQSLIEIESQIGKYLEGSNYSDPYRTIADFLKHRAFHGERLRKVGFIDRLFGG